jgi:hypothetical protein
MALIPPENYVRRRAYRSNAAIEPGIADALAVTKAHATSSTTWVMRTGPTQRTMAGQRAPDVSKAALRASSIDRVYVNTESSEIAAVAKTIGVEVYLRPASLAAGRHDGRDLI